MKSKNLNNSSKKTKTIIRNTFAELLSEKKEINKITVTELVEKANINRSTFYTHYDDIYSVAEDFENELVDEFFDNITLLASQDINSFIEVFFDYIKKNQDVYILLCKSNDLLFTINRLLPLMTGKILEIIYNTKSLKDKTDIEVEINVFVQGLLSEYIRFCRGATLTTPAALHRYAIKWSNNFKKEHFN